MTSNGFSFVEANRCLYIKSLNGECIISCLYVDDMLIFQAYDVVVNNIKLFLASKFDMKDMGEASVTLGIKIKRKGDSIILF